MINVIIIIFIIFIIIIDIIFVTINSDVRPDLVGVILTSELSLQGVVAMWNC